MRAPIRVPAYTRVEPEPILLLTPRNLPTSIFNDRAAYREKVAGPKADTTTM